MASAHVVMVMVSVMRTSSVSAIFFYGDGAGLGLARTVYIHRI
jgi:hypothetical protein